MSAHPYFDVTAALLTQHGKERALAPLFRDALSIQLVVARGLNTDWFGTFTREFPRRGTQADAAHGKACWASRLTRLEFGLGSEGAFVPGPFGVGAVDVELVTWVDARRRLRVTGAASAPSVHHHQLVRTEPELVDAVRRCRFPSHAVVVRPDGPHGARATRGLATWPELEAAFQGARRRSANGTVFVENDLRAHVHPSRMALITRAAEDLLQRLQTLCPRCAAPGFGRARVIPGNPCRCCGSPTTEALADEFGCVACPFRDSRPRAAAAADPERCPQCNP